MLPVAPQHYGFAVGLLFEPWLPFHHDRRLRGRDYWRVNMAYIDAPCGRVGAFVNTPCQRPARHRTGWRGTPYARVNGVTHPRAWRAFINDNRGPAATICQFACDHRPGLPVPTTYRPRLTCVGFCAMPPTINRLLPCFPACHLYTD